MSEHIITHPNMVRNAKEAKRLVCIYSYDHDALKRVLLMYEDYTFDEHSIFYEYASCLYVLKLRMPPYVRNQMAKDLELVERPKSYNRRVHGKEYFLKLRGENIVSECTVTYPNKEKTAKDIFNTLNEDQKTVVYAIVGQTLESGEKVINETQKEVFDTLNEDQKAVVNAIVEQVVEDGFFIKDVLCL